MVGTSGRRAGPARGAGDLLAPASPRGLLLLLLLVPACLLGVSSCGGGGGGPPADDTSPDDPAPEPEPEPEPAPDWSHVRFVEVSDAVGLVSTFMPPRGQWRTTRNMAGGGSVGDFDRDGWQDVFVCGGGEAPDRLFLGDGDGTFTDHAAAWGVDAVHFGTGSAVGDYDGDGWLDLFVASAGDPVGGTGPGRHRLYRNLGGTGFEEVAAAAGVATASPTQADTMGAAFGDFDLDGDLDLVVCGWADPNEGTRLFANNGDGTFSDVTALALPPRALHAFSPRFVDMDGDRYPELLIAADYRTSAYLVNRGDGSFEDRTVASGTGLDTNGMGHVVADLDGDGRLDWFVTSIYDADPAGGGDPIGNMYYVSQGDHEFAEQATAAGIEDGSWAWGAAAVDVDHDGRLDLAVTNGWGVGAPDGLYGSVPSRLYMNGGDAGFTDVAVASGLDHTGQGRGLVHLDLDNDGDQDLIVFGCEEPMRVFRNETETAGPWLRVALDTSADAGLAPDGFGTRVRFRTGSRTQVRTLDGGSGYLGSSELLLHVGLNSVARLDEVIVEWADGRETTLIDVPANQTLTIASPGP